MFFTLHGCYHLQGIFGPASFIHEFTHVAIFIAYLCYIAFCHILHKHTDFVVGFYIYCPSLFFFPWMSLTLFTPLWCVCFPNLTVPSNPKDPPKDKSNKLESKPKSLVGESSACICINISRRKKIAGQSTITHFPKLNWKCSLTFQNSGTQSCFLCWWNCNYTIGQFN